ncbi:RNA methyltransferase [Hornefia porci]|uniref:RNA methyltransferase n=1 Tax=Hornefia porci TaxID=2652292 RepID=A0A1Q9JF89_9FIRM|nr:TlyA family RNA methyltransferase [Hornefia porci]OLR54853.1 RNA methyltransferase [Hornefia porci]
MKERLDVLLVQKGFFDSREKARRSIMAGLVFVDGQRSDKAGNRTDTEAEIAVRGNECPYVSRGGYKLEKSIRSFGLELSGKICGDIGASTGGFTDCMLQNGAKRVYAMDVGYGQLDWKLRTDPRVVNMEKCNVRYLDPAHIPEPLDFISIDVSFISLKMILPVAEQLLGSEGEIVCLVKPQFEAGREQVGKKGIVRAPEVHCQVIRRCIGYAEENDLVPYGLTYSPVTGAKGNIEYLLHVGKPEKLRYNQVTVDELIDNVVKQSHEELR